MARSNRVKRRHTGNKEQHSSALAINPLPRDLLVKVIASIASHSFTDLHNLKRCSKDFLEASEDDYVLRRVSLDTFPFIPWKPLPDKASSFLERCRESENVESLFREGLQEYFHDRSEKTEYGLEIMKMAAQKGHKEAKYVCGMISLCSKDDEVRKQGLDYMRFLRKSKCVISCRKKLGQMLPSMWRNNEIVARNQNSLCNFKSTCKGWRGKNNIWAILKDEDDDLSSCEFCRWDHELEFFYQMFNH